MHVDVHAKSVHGESQILSARPSEELLSIETPSMRLLYRMEMRFAYMQGNLVPVANNSLREWNTVYPRDDASEYDPFLSAVDQNNDPIFSW